LAKHPGVGSLERFAYEVLLGVEVAMYKGMVDTCDRGDLADRDMGGTPIGEEDIGSVERCISDLI